jgi:hypothetical protein
MFCNFLTILDNFLFNFLQPVNISVSKPQNWLANRSNQPTSHSKTSHCLANSDFEIWLASYHR